MITGIVSALLPRSCVSRGSVLKEGDWFVCDVRWCAHKWRRKIVQIELQPHRARYNEHELVNVVGVKGEGDCLGWACA